MPIPIEYVEIINDLERATAEERVAWNSSQFGVYVEIFDSVLELWGGDDAETERPFVSCSLQSAKDRSRGLQRKTPLDSWFVDEGDVDFPRMSRLLVSAKRQMLGVPKKLLAIAEALKSTGTIGVRKQEKPDGEDDLPF